MCDVHIQIHPHFIMLNNIKTAAYSELEILRYFNKLFISWRDEINTNVPSKIAPDIDYSNFVGLQFIVVFFIFDIPYILQRINPFLLSFTDYDLVYYFAGIPMLMFYIFHCIFYYCAKPNVLSFIQLHAIVWFFVLLLLSLASFGMNFLCITKALIPLKQTADECFHTIHEAFFTLFAGLIFGVVGLCYYIATFPYLLHIIGCTPLIFLVVYLVRAMTGVFVKYKDIRHAANRKRVDNVDFI